MSKFDLTVAMPVYNSSPIAWLPLESLCRQETDFTWELVAIEDPSEKFCGVDYFREYEDRLNAAGCQRLEYIEIPEWIPLGKKWKNIASNAKGDRFMLTACDDYSPKDRIEVTCNNMTKGIKWFDCRESLFYDISTGKDASFVVNANYTGIWMATRTELVRKLRDPFPSKGVDAWIQRNFKLKPQEKKTIKDPLLGLCTDGANNISHDRKKRYNKGIANKQSAGSSFVESKQSLSEILPASIYNRLKSINL